MSKTAPTIEIFRPGTFTSMEGTDLTVTAADLEAAAAAYDFAAAAAPVVIGHPKIDAPAYGWAKSLKFEGDRLVAELSDVEVNFAEAVRAKRYKNVSASFYPAGHAHNPVPGALYLKHIGFLGAVPPAVKGLAPVSFAAGAQEGCITIETEKETSVPKTPEEQTLEFAEREAALAARETAIGEREAANAKRESDAAVAAAAALHNDNVSFAQAQISAGRLAPAGADLVVFVADALGADQSLSFGEGDDAISPVAAFRKLFDGARPIVSFGEAAAPSGDEQIDLNSPTAIAAAALSFVEEQKAKGSIVRLEAAVRHVSRAQG